MYQNDKRIVLTLDAGGTNFVFSAIQANQEIVEPFNLPANASDLNICLDTLVKGFAKLIDILKSKELENPVAISFAFPGPADYKNGVIGDLPNFPAFRGGVALGPYLQERFNIPVYINNDGNLFAYGEALAGALPQINNTLKEKNCYRRYNNLIGITFGTGFGSGVVINNELLTGDNGCSGDIWVFRNKLNPDMIAEENVSIRAVVREYNKMVGIADENITPKDIFDIAEGKKKGDKEAAIKSFKLLGEVAGDAIAHMLTFVDGVIVLGGGIIGAAKYIVPAMKDEMQSKLATFSGLSFDRLQMKIYDLNNDLDNKNFFTDKSNKVIVPNSNKEVRYNSLKQAAIVVSSIGANNAISLGAYSYALSELDKL